MENLDDTSVLMLLKEMTSPVVMMNGKREIIFWNNGACDVFGYSELETVGKGVSFLIPKRYQKRYDTSIDSFIAKTENTEERIIQTSRLGKDTEFYGLRKNGQEFPCEIVTLCYSEDVRKAFVAFVYDLSDGIFSFLKNVTKKLETIDHRLNTLESRVAGL